MKSGAIRQAAVSSVSQALFTLNNLVFSLALASSSDNLSQFGALSGIYMIGMWLIGILNAAVNEPVATGEWNDNHSLGASLKWATVCVVIFCPIGILYSLGTDRSDLLVMCIVISLSVFVITARNYFIAASLPARAMAIDATWLFSFVPMYFILRNTGVPDPSKVSGLWLISGLFGLLIAYLIGRRSGSVSKAVTIKPNWSYAYDQVLAFGAFRVSLLLLGAISGAAALGQVRLVMVLLGPLNTLINVIRLSITPILSKDKSKIFSKLLLPVMVGLIAIASICYVVAVFFVFLTPSALIHIKLLPSDELFTLVSLSRIAFCISIGCLIVLRLRGDSNTGKINTISTIVIIFLCVVGATLDGIDGYAYALLVASILSTTYWLWSSRHSKTRQTS